MKVVFCNVTCEQKCKEDSNSVCTSELNVNAHISNTFVRCAFEVHENTFSMLFFIQFRCFVFTFSFCSCTKRQVTNYV